MSNIEGKMKQQQKRKSGGLKFMGMCFSSNESQQQHQSLQEQPHLQKQQQFQHQSPHQNRPQHIRGGAGHRGSRTNPVLNQAMTTTSKKEESKGQKQDNKNPNFLFTPKDVKELRQHPEYSNVDIFTFEEMKLATKHFRPDLILGEGGFGVVYRGVIDESVRPGYKSTEVAIKQLNPNGFQGDKEWLTEVSYLGQLSHPNLVKLIGYCCEDEHRLLVYEYMACACLEKHLFRRMSATLTWLRRVKIALDAAKGLAFLHGLERQIIITDFNAKLSDFGLAKEGPRGDQTHVSTRVMGTYGSFDARSDVYGFGVVLLEMLIGRRALDKSRPSREHNLVEWCRPLLNNNKKLLRILDARIDGQYSIKAMMRVANLGHQCLSQNPKGRPLMSQAVEVLEAVYEEEKSREMAFSQRKPDVNPQVERKIVAKSEEERAVRSRRRRREGRSRSEPQNDILSENSPEVRTHHRSHRDPNSE
ncbi:putative serine/threonine-protein kinase PBL17 [Bienertia sinuspersici]